MDSNKLSYLQMIQEPINRLSTIGSVFKGFTSTMVAAIVLINYSSINIIVLILSIFIVLIFMILDAYYLSLERKFRTLYNFVLLDEVPCDFSMNINIEKIKNNSNCKLCKCLQSKSIILFYGALMIIMCTVVILKNFNLL